jgi:hypothetical protein
MLEGVHHGLGERLRLVDRRRVHPHRLRPELGDGSVETRASADGDDHLLRERFLDHVVNASARGEE